MFPKGRLKEALLLAALVVSQVSGSPHKNKETNAKPNFVVLFADDVS